MSRERHNEFLSRFLRSRRAALSPQDLGLPRNRGGSSPGLRREEVAALAGVSVTWYTWLEQGRDIRVSTKLLERLCCVLRLSADRRDYLFALAHNRPPPLLGPAPNEDYEASRLLWQTLAALTVPAIALTYRWDVVAWNSLILHFLDYAKLPPRSRNWLRLLVTDPLHRSDPGSYEDEIRFATSSLRGDYGQVSKDPVLDDLIEELSVTCPVFKRHWEGSDQLGSPQGQRVVLGHRLGDLEFRRSLYIPKGETHIRVTVFMPASEECARRVAILARSQLSPESEDEQTVEHAHG